MDNTERLINEIRIKQERFEAKVDMYMQKTDESIERMNAEQAEWRKRHDEELREYREDMRQLKITSDEKFDRMSAKIDNMNKYLSRMSVTSMASVIGMGLVVLYFIATH